MKEHPNYLEEFENCVKINFNDPLTEYFDEQEVNKVKEDN